MSRLLLRRLALQASSVLGVVLALGAPAQGLGLELEGRYWAPDLDGVLRISDGDLGLGIDFARELGLEADDVLEGRFTFRPGLGIFFRAAYLSMSVAGERSLDFDDLPIPIDGSLRGSLDLDYARIALGWQFVTPKKFLRIGPYAEAKGVRGDAELAARIPVIGEIVSEDFEGAFASVGGLLEVQPTDKLQLFGEVSVLVGEDEADWTDAEVGVRFYPLSLIGIGVGYRLIEIGGEIDNVRPELDLKGFFLTGVLRF